MKIGNLLVNASYLGSKALTAIAVGATKVWEGVSKYIKFKDPVVEQLCMKWSSDGIGLTPEDAAKVTNIGTTFQGNTEITSFDELEKFTSVTSLGSLTETGDNGVFNKCTNLKQVKLSRNIKSLGGRAFRGCLSLSILDIPESVEEIGHLTFALVPCPMVVNLPRLNRIENYRGICAPWFNSGVTRIDAFGNPPTTDSLFTDHSGVYGVFVNCIHLEYANIDKLEKVGQWFFYGCTSLRIVIMSKANRINKECFYGCSMLETIILDKKSCPVLDASAFRGTPSTMSIYVPDESVEAYKSATNWSAYADRIKPLSEYVEPTNE